MQLKEFGVSLGDLIHEFNFEVVYGPEGFEKTEITKDDVNRPGLQLAGFFDYFDPNRIQIMGKVESSYVEGLSSEERRSRFDRLFETRCCCSRAILTYFRNALRLHRSTVCRSSVPTSLPLPS